jgi:hypothetical protein
MSGRIGLAVRACQAGQRVAFLTATEDWAAPPMSHHVGGCRLN